MRKREDAQNPLLFHILEYMRTLAAVYFSGTGNTRYICEYLLGLLSAEYSCKLLDVTGGGDLLGEAERADVLLLAFPIYGSAPPIPMRQFVVRCQNLLRGKEVILVETQYFFSGDGAASLGRTVEKFGGKVIGAEMFNMPNNLSDCKAFPIRNGTKLKGTLRRARARADRFAADLLKGRTHRRGFSFLSRGVGYFSQRKYWRKGEAGKRDRLRIDPSRCAGCGLCAESCPVQNLVRGKPPRPKGKCVLCYRCVNRCPVQAITLIGSAPPRVQYKGPKD